MHFGFQTFPAGAPEEGIGQVRGAPKAIAHVQRHRTPVLLLYIHWVGEVLNVWQVPIHGVGKHLLYTQQPTTLAKLKRRCCNPRLCRQLWGRHCCPGAAGAAHLIVKDSEGPLGSPGGRLRLQHCPLSTLKPAITLHPKAETFVHEGGVADVRQSPSRLARLEPATCRLCIRLEPRPWRGVWHLFLKGRPIHRAACCTKTRQVWAVEKGRWCVPCR
mmetsp:Transcript_84777/g.225170  ORF Transcript_84777/g.225170 Transcript_84777/m.225170 type:complete len:216 (+) Transcript_84777:324-971(+)